MHDLPTLACLLLLPLVAGCASTHKATQAPAADPPKASATPATPAPLAANTEITAVTDGASAEAALGKRVRITGLARNAKLSAVVAADQLHLHCIELQSWPEAVLGKRVVVTGTLAKTDRFRSRTDEDGAISQGTEGAILVLRDVTYELGE